MGQSIVLGEIKAEVLLQNENLLNHQILWQLSMVSVAQCVVLNALHTSCSLPE